MQNGTKTHAKYHVESGLSTSPHLSIASAQAIIQFPIQNKFS